jgi:hypothetical protein
MVGGPGALPPGKHQKLGVDQQQFGGGFLAVPARFHSRTNRIDPSRGMLSPRFLPPAIKVRVQERMALAFGAMTGGFSATAVGQRQRAWQGVIGEAETGQKPARMAAQCGRLRAARGVGKATLDI